MQIKCIKCKQEFELEKEKIKEIERLIVGKMSPRNLLRILTNLSEDCPESVGKGHVFVYGEKFTEQKKEIIGKYDKVNKELEVEKENLRLSEQKENILLADKEKFRDKIVQINDEIFKNGQMMNDISAKISDDEILVGTVVDEFEEITGTRDIKSWFDVPLEKKEEKKEEKEEKK